MRTVIAEQVVIIAEQVVIKKAWWDEGRHNPQQENPDIPTN